eukprot:COSAG02_NODE_3478_length_6673_cov_14.589747_1_plen_71_part_00
MVNTMVGDLFDMEDTSIALSCSNIATSLTAGSAFIIGTPCILHALLLWLDSQERLHHLCTQKMRLFAPHM